MSRLVQRRIPVLVFAFVCFVVLLHSRSVKKIQENRRPALPPPMRHVNPVDLQSETYSWHWWEKYRHEYLPESLIPLPTGKPAKIPRIQHKFPWREGWNAKKVREERREAVKEAFRRSWYAYREHAWMADEITPVTGAAKTSFSGWGATLVDSLDTLWIMGLKGEFEEAVDAVKDIDFSDSPTGDLNVFETTIRYLGGFLAAYDISGGKYPVLLEKATEVGELLYVAFDTPNRMPVLRWNWPSARDGKPQVAGDGIVVAELGSLSVEFTRLSQLTGNPRFYDAVQRITDALERNQNATRLPGLWPVAADTKNLTFSLDNRFTFGAMADSLYEYLPKEYLLLGGRCNQYKEMYERVIEVGKKELFFRPRTPHGDDILLSGQAVAGIEDKLTLMPEGQHLTCFVGGMVAMAAKIFNRPDEVEIGRKLTEGCVWAYNSTPTGIMPENFMAEPCYNDTDCVWSPRLWFQGPEYEHLMDHELERKGRLQGLIPGFRSVYDRRYLLRPEAIESVFILYRITGDTSFQDKGWNMFTGIEKHARSELAYGAVSDVTIPEPTALDEMESFWLGETLKYFYLLFSEPDFVSLDKYVFNTEAHPLLRPV